MRRARGVLAGLWLAAAACMAPAPPFLVETEHGAVHAESGAEAEHTAALLEELLPEVRALLPGTQDRPVEVWVQGELRLFRYRERPERVRGFTLMSAPFHASRIHLRSGGRTRWYLAHELVHALVDPSWATLPGILEEGLADVVAARLEPDAGRTIRVHRLLDASAFTGGLDVLLGIRDPDAPARVRAPRHEIPVRVHLQPDQDPAVAEALLASNRRLLFGRWPQPPESFYGLAWLVVDRIVERRGLDGLHALCMEARAEGRPIVPARRLLAAAELDPRALDPAFLARLFDDDTFHLALAMRPDAFAAVPLTLLDDFRDRIDRDELLFRLQPTLRLEGLTPWPLHAVPPLFDAVTGAWNPPTTP